MFTTTSFSSRLVQYYRQAGVVRFDVRVIPDDQGFQNYQLCAQQKRHYSVKFRKGEGHHISSAHTACDLSCVSGKLVENTSPELLLAVGINKRVPAGLVLVILEERHLIKSHKEYAAGSIVEPDMFSSGRILKNGEAVETIRTLNHSERIDLTPMAVNGGNWRRIREKERIVTEIVDRITNVDGKPVITNNEASLRAERDRLNQEFQAAMKKVEDERKNCGKDYAKEVGKWLREECGFRFEQVGKLFEIAGPGQCRDAVERARIELDEMNNPLPEKDLLDDWGGMDLDIMDYAYRSSERKDWRRINAGVDYIISIGGVPADKKKK